MLIVNSYSSKINEIRLVCLLLMLIFLIKGVFYAVYITPPMAGTSPDDIGHISYIQYLASEKEFPVMYEASMESESMASFRDYKSGVLNYLDKYTVDQETFDPKEDYNWIVQHPPLYYLLMTPVYLFVKLFTNELYILILSLRIATIPLGLATMFVMNKILHTLQTGSVTRYCILISFVFSAPIQYYFSNITNDSLLIFLSILALYFLLKYTINNIKTDLYLFVISCAFILLTKFTGALVVVCYVAYLLYYSLKQKGYKEMIKVSFLGIVIGSIIIAPVYCRNYFLYGRFMPVFDQVTQKHDLSFLSFIRDSGYFNELFSHIICLVGWVNMVRPTDSMKFGMSLLLVVLAALCILKKKNTLSLVVLLGVIIAGLWIKYFLNLQLSLIIAVCSFAIICYSLLSMIQINRSIKRVYIFFIVTIIFVFLIFFIQHYDIYLSRGRTGAMHGRYYYIVYFQFMYLCYGILDEYKIRIKRFFPFLLATILILIESQIIKICLSTF